MRPVTPSSNCLASYRPLPFLRAVFQSLARAIFTDAELGESLHRAPQKSTPTGTAAASLSLDYDKFFAERELLPKVSTAEKNLGGR